MTESPTKPVSGASNPDAPHKLAVGDVDDKARALLRELGEIK